MICAESIVPRPADATVQRGTVEPLMSKLGFLIYILTAPAVAGALMIIVLSMPGYKSNTLITAALAGFVAALPIAWAVTKKLAGKI
jgi:hypothetical protein